MRVQRHDERGWIVFDDKTGAVISGPHAERQNVPEFSHTFRPSPARPVRALSDPLRDFR